MPSSTTPKFWTRSTTRSRCPICRRSGCLVSSPTEPGAVVCSRTSSARQIGTVGFLHVLDDKLPPWIPWRVALVRLGKLGGTDDG